MTDIWRLYILNVGDGDCLFLENDSQSFNMLIDGGKNGTELIGFLKEKQINHIDLLISSHCHQDHAGGMMAILSMVSVGEFWSPYPLENNSFQTAVSFQADWPREAKMGLGALKIYQRLLDQLACKQVPCKTVHAGHTYTHDKLLISIMYPPAEVIDDFCRDARLAYDSPGAENYGRLMGKMNATSLFITLKIGRAVIHLPSDPPVEKTSCVLLEQCKLLKLAHHGCIDGVSEKLITCLQPREVVISAAGDSPEFPSPETLDLLAMMRRQDDLDFVVHYTDTPEKLPYLLFEISPDGQICRR